MNKALPRYLDSTHGLLHILCDYDGEIPSDVWDRLEMVARIEKLRIRYVRFDRTRHDYHMIVACSDFARKHGSWMSPERLVALQAILGSDWKREAFNLHRVRNLKDFPAFWHSRWNVLYHTHYRRVTLLPQPEVQHGKTEKERERSVTPAEGRFHGTRRRNGSASAGNDGAERRSCKRRNRPIRPHGRTRQS